MSIFILEDQEIQSAFLEGKIREQFELLGKIHEKILCFKKANELLMVAKKNLEYNIYFLDLQIGKNIHSGLEVAKTIRTFDEQAMIVFVTSHSELALLAYYSEVSAYTFIEKSLALEEMLRLISNCLKLYLKRRDIRKYNVDDLFILKTKSEDKAIVFDDIFYFSTTYEHQLKISTKEFSKEFRGNLKDIEKQEPKLLRVHQSHLVNPNKISGFNHQEHLLIFPDGNEIKISRKYYKNVLPFIEKVLNRTK